MLNKKSYTYTTAKTCSISFKRDLPPDVLVSLLAGKEPLTKEWLFHISTLFNEVPVQYLVNTLKENNLFFNDAEKLYKALPAPLKNSPYCFQKISCF